LALQTCPTTTISLTSQAGEDRLAPATGYRSGQYGKASFPLGSVPRLTVPRRAVVEYGQLQGVFVVNAQGQVELNAEPVSGVMAVEDLLSQILTLAQERAFASATSR
jgi:hypothetical protein